MTETGAATAAPAFFIFRMNFFWKVVSRTDGKCEYSNTKQIMEDVKMNANIIKVSRWIKIKDELVTSRHSLYEYGYSDESPESSKRRWVSCFRHGGRLWALDEFLRVSWPIYTDAKTGEDVIISGYDGGNYYNPYLLEISDGGEYVRLWEEL